jgi:hypothetical protein
MVFVCDQPVVRIDYWLIVRLTVSVYKKILYLKDLVPVWIFIALDYWLIVAVYAGSVLDLGYRYVCTVSFWDFL